MNYSLAIYNILDNYVWSWMNLNLVNELVCLSFFSFFSFFFTLKVFVSLKIEKIYTTDKRNEKQKRKVRENLEKS